MSIVVIANKTFFEHLNVLLFNRRCFICVQYLIQAKFATSSYLPRGGHREQNTSVRQHGASQCVTYLRIREFAASQEREERVASTARESVRRSRPTA